MIRPAADRKNAFLRCRSHALTMARRVGRLPTPWTVSTPHRPSGISVLSNFYDRQSLVYQHSCRPRGRQPPQGESTQKDTGAGAPLRGIVQLLVSLFFSGILFSPRRAGREAFVTAKSFQMGTGALRLSFPNGCPGKLLPKEVPRRTLTYKSDNVCNASIPSITGPRPAPAISAESAHRINYNFCIPPYIADVKI